MLHDLMLGGNCETAPKAQATKTERDNNENTRRKHYSTRKVKHGEQGKYLLSEYSLI